MKVKVINITKTYLVLPLANGYSLRLNPKETKEVTKELVDTPYLKRMATSNYIRIKDVVPSKVKSATKNKKED